LEECRRGEIQLRRVAEDYIPNAQVRNPEKKKMESIYKVARTVKRREQSLYNALRSIHHDYSMFIREIALLWPELALLANKVSNCMSQQHICYCCPSSFKIHNLCSRT
jgi:hypothetical protein